MQCIDGGSMCPDCEAQGQCLTEIHTAPGDLAEDKHSTSGMGTLLLYALGVVSLIAAGALAL